MHERDRKRSELSETGKQILVAALRLDANEREALAQKLLMGMHEECGQILEAWLEECKRRIEAVDSGELSLVAGEQVMEELRERLKQYSDLRGRS
jgi:putative addiction module component (TIGR02574 family)